MNEQPEQFPHDVEIVVKFKLRKIQGYEEDHAEWLAEDYLEGLLFDVRKSFRDYGDKDTYEFVSVTASKEA